MADLFSRRKTWCCFWPCLVIIYLWLPSVLAYDTVHIHPEGIIKVRLGEALELFCEDDSSADSLTFTAFTDFKDSGLPLLPVEKINNKTVRIYKKMDVKGLYNVYCVNFRRCYNQCPAARTRVVVDEPPHDVTEFQCKSYNLDQLNCTWTDPQALLVTKYSLAFIMNGQKTVECMALKSASTSYCTWDTISNPRYRQLEKKFYFTLTSTNAFGSNEQNFTVDHFSVVQPAPVSYLRVSEIGDYTATLQWRVSNNMVDLMPNGVRHKIEYQAELNDNTFPFQSVDTSSLPLKNVSYRFQLSLPYAHVKYQVRVSIRPVEATGEQYWSVPRYVTVLDP